jgi:hypothetical protein
MSIAPPASDSVTNRRELEFSNQILKTKQDGTDRRAERQETADHLGARGNGFRRSHHFRASRFVYPVDMRGAADSFAGADLAAMASSQFRQSPDIRSDSCRRTEVGKFFVGGRWDRNRMISKQGIGGCRRWVCGRELLINFDNLHVAAGSRAICTIKLA